MAYLKQPLVWLFAAVVACAALGFAYLPPRGSARDVGFGPGLVTGPPTRERLRANELAKEWRRAALDARLREWRVRLAPELNRRRAADLATVVTIIDTTWPRELRARATAEIADAWQSLGLGTTKIGVAVVVEPERVAPTVPSPTASAYLLPDSVDRTTCIAWIPPTGLHRAVLERPGEQQARVLSAWTRRLLGPCAFYARFGNPSVAVERWLAARQHRFAQGASWDSIAIRADGPWYGYTGPASERQRAAWAQWAYQLFPSTVLGCMAERTHACRDAVVGDAAASGNVPRLLMRSRDAARDLPGSSLLLAEMVRGFGTARFARFWIAELPPDSAFHVAMDTTLGDWVLSLQRTYGTTLVADPTPSPSTTVFGLAAAVLAIFLTMIAAARRQIG